MTVNLSLSRFLTLRTANLKDISEDPLRHTENNAKKMRKRRQAELLGATELRQGLQVKSLSWYDCNASSLHFKAGEDVQGSEEYTESASKQLHVQNFLELIL